MPAGDQIKDMFGLSDVSTGNSARSPQASPKPAKVKPATASIPSEQDNLSSAYGEWKQHPGPDAMDGILRAATPAISRGVASFGADTPLARSRARILTTEAVKNYDPASGSSLGTWIHSNLRGLTRYVGQLSPVRMPERIRYDLNKLKLAETEMTDELGRPPTDTELADSTGISLRRMAHIRKNDVNTVAESSLTDEEGSPYLPATQYTSPESIWAEYVYHDLSPTDQKIYDGMTGKSGGPAAGVTQLAKELGITAGAVSQRATKIASKLNEFQTVK
jgi:DNA-directed RNA polymerase specialized sigma subunit